MEQHGKLYRANVILAALFGVLLLVDVLSIFGVTNAFRRLESQKLELIGEGNGEEQWQPGDDPDDYNQNYDFILIEDIQAKPLGMQWQGQKAKQGYQYYQVEAKVKNQGTQEEPAGDLYISLTGDGAKDLIKTNKTDQGDDGLQLHREGVIPAGQTGLYQEILQVRDGVKNITFEYFGDEAEKYQIPINP